MDYLAKTFLHVLVCSSVRRKQELCFVRDTIVRGQCQNSNRIQQTLLGFKSILSVNSCENTIQLNFYIDEVDKINWFQ